MEKCSLLSLPDLVLVQILAFFPIQDLLQSVATTCKRLHSIIECNSVLWSDFAPYCFSLATKEHLQRICSHSLALTRFVIPYGSFDCSPPDIDFIFSTSLCNAKSLCWLDVTNCKLSTLCFLNFLPNLEILNVSDCRNLVDADFQAVKSCDKLTQLYVSFTRIKPDTIVSICAKLTLTVLDASGIPLQVGHCERILSHVLLYFQVTLDTFDDEPLFHGLFDRYRDCSVHVVRRILND